MRTFKLNLTHIEPLKKAFMKCDKKHCGKITLKSFIKRIAKMKTQVPKTIFHFFVNALMDKAPVSSDFYENKQIIDVNEVLSFRKL